MRRFATSPGFFKNFGSFHGTFSISVVAHFQLSKLYQIFPLRVPYLADCCILILNSYKNKSIAQELLWTIKYRCRQPKQHINCYNASKKATQSGPMTEHHWMNWRHGLIWLSQPLNLTTIQKAPTAFWKREKT